MKIVEDKPLLPLLFLLSVLVFWCSTAGPDYWNYREWGEALLRGSATSIKSNTVSPSGMPVSHWGHGTGVVLGIFSLAFPAFFGPSLSAQCVGVVLFLMSSLSLWGILNALGLERPLKLLVYSLFLAGTNFGYYFVYLASEAVTSAILLTLSWVVLVGRRNTLISAVALGVGSCMLVTSRVQAALTLLPLFGVFAWREVRSWDTLRSSLFFGVVGLGFLVGVLQVMQVNQWMTGSWLHSPLVFGDGTFQSFGAPRFAGRVLLSSRVGILVRTPLVAVAFLASLVLSFRKSVPAEWRLFFGLACLVNLANLAMVSGYYAWSGGSSFGSRYFIPSASLLFMALPIVLRDVEVPRNVAGLAFLLSLLAIPTVLSLIDVNGAHVLVGVMALTMWAAVPNRSWAGCSRVMSAVTAISTVILSEFLYFAICRQGSFSGVLDSVSLPVRLWGLTPPLTLLVAISVKTYVNGANKPPSFDPARAKVGIAMAGFVLVMFQAVKFIEFRSATEAYRLGQITRPDARFKFRAPFHFENFSDDVDGAKEGYEYSDREIVPLRTFRDATREAAALQNP